MDMQITQSVSALLEPKKIQNYSLHDTHAYYCMTMQKKIACVMHVVWTLCKESLMYSKKSTHDLVYVMAGIYIVVWLLILWDNKRAHLTEEIT
jgi:hypothetical protein